MKTVVLMIASLLISTSVWAQTKMKFSFNNEEITKIIEAYALNSGQKFVVDTTVRGKATILNQGELTAEEAFDQLSYALSVNGFAISKNNDVFVVKNARSTQRDNIEVTKEMPTAKPQRMATWVINLKNISAQDMAEDLRLLTSSYGEMTVVKKNNQIVITDWVSNLQRVGAIIKEVDVQPSASVSKIVFEAKQERDARKSKMTKQLKEAGAPKKDASESENSNPASKE